MTQHVPPPTDAAERVDYRKLFHRQAMRARARMEMSARLRGEIAAAPTPRKSIPMRIYSAPIGPICPVVMTAAQAIPPRRLVMRVGPDGETWVEPSIASIQREVCERFGVGMNELLSGRRQAYLVIARQFAMWRCRRETTRSFPDIGRRFGGKDHTTVLHAVRKMEALHASGELAAKGLVP